MRHLFLILILAAAFVGCQKTPVETTGKEPEAAHYKTGHGVGLPPAMKESLGVKVAEVAEEKIAPRLTIPLHMLHENRRGASEAYGWLTAEQAREVRPGQGARLLLPDGQTAEGTVRRVEKATMGASGEYEVTIGTDAALETGARITAILDGTLTGEVVAVPASALMKTAEGEFVYVANEEYFKRTPVKTGTRNEELVEIKDGLYPGDQIVVSQLTPLWMTELQTLRAGQSCCAGH